MSANYFIFYDNVRILCLSCNMEKSKPPTQFFRNKWNKRCSYRFQWCQLWCQHLYCYHFFLSLYMNQVPEMVYLVHDLITLKFIWPFWPPLLGLCLNITQLEDKFRLRHDCFYISLLIIQRPTYTVSAQRSMGDNDDQADIEKIMFYYIRIHLVLTIKRSENIDQVDMA